MAVYRPWRIDMDNAQGVIVKDDRGTVVHAADYGDIPDERGPAFREQIVQQERENAYAMVEGVNASR